MVHTSSTNTITLRPEDMFGDSITTNVMETGTIPVIQTNNSKTKKSTKLDDDLL